MTRLALPGVVPGSPDAPQYVPPEWPASRGGQQYQPKDGVRVYLDPAGHPFCLFLPG